MLSIDHLPSEILLAILRACVTLDSLLALSSTSRTLRTVYHDNEKAIICAVLPNAIPGYYNARLLALEELQMYEDENELDEAMIRRDVHTWLPDLLRNATLAQHVCQEYLTYLVPNLALSFEFAEATNAQEVSTRIQPTCCDRASYKSSYYLYRRLRYASAMPHLLPRLRAQLRAEPVNDLAAHTHFSFFLLSGLIDGGQGVVYPSRPYRDDVQQPASLAKGRAHETALPKRYAFAPHRLGLGWCFAYKEFWQVLESTGVLPQPKLLCRGHAHGALSI